MGRAILVVEDDETVRDFVVAVLRGAGHEVLTAESVDAARKIIFARPDAEALCLVIDIVLHRESGVEFAQELLRRYPRFRVLLISGFTDEVLVASAEVEAHMVFLPKPFTGRDLVTALDQLCE